MQWTIKLSQITPIQKNIQNNRNQNNNRNQQKQIHKNNFYQPKTKILNQYFNSNSSMPSLLTNNQIFARNMRHSNLQSFSVRNRKRKLIKQLNQFHYLEYIFYRRKCLSFNKIKQKNQFVNNLYSQNCSRNVLTLEKAEDAFYQLNMFIKIKNQNSMVKAFIRMKTITQMDIEHKHRIQNQYLISQFQLYPQNIGLLKLNNIIKRLQQQKQRNVIQFLRVIRQRSRLKEKYLKRVFEIIFLNNCSDQFKIIKYYNNYGIKKILNMFKILKKQQFKCLIAFFHKIKTIKMLLYQKHSISSSKISLKSNHSIHQINQDLIDGRHNKNVNVQVVVKQKEIKKGIELKIPVEVKVKIKKNHKQQNLQIYNRIYRNLSLVQISNKKKQLKKSNIKEYRVNFH